MAVETSSQHVATNNQSSVSNPNNGLLPGERVIAELSSSDRSSFQLTHARVIYRGGSDSKSVYAASQLKDITSVQISRRPRARRSAAWGVVGLFAAIGVWQVTPDSGVGILSAIAVALVSLVMMADYWVRPSGVHLEFHTSGGNVIGGEVRSKPALAMKFTQDVEDAKRRLIPSRIGSPFRNYPSGR